MKRRLIKSNFAENSGNDVSDSELIKIPNDLEDYANYLRLLNDIPLTYLLTDPSDLDEETIRFGILDINWIDAYLDGAFSIGRVCESDCKIDKSLKKSFNANKNQINYLRIPRMQKMHPNHIVKQTLLQKQKINDSDNVIDCSNISVVLIRSDLVKMKKELHYIGYDKDSFDKLNLKATKEPLPSLRIEKISDDIMICLFSGIVDTFIIEEPLTGLKFGCDGSWYNKNNAKIALRSPIENSDFGTFLNKWITINPDDKKCIDANGRIHPEEIAGIIETELNKIGTLNKNKHSIFAFEMLAVPQRAIFSTGKLNA